MDSPDLSVVIATRNRADLLRQTLEHLRRQQLGGLCWELLVVDNGSEDDTDESIREALEFLPLRPLRESRPGKNRALNKAVSVARSQLLVFTDDDVIPDRAWLSELHRAATRWPTDTVFAGRIEPRFPAATPGWLADPGWRRSTVVFCRYAPQPGEGSVELAPFGANLAIRRSVFQSFRYDESIGPRGRSYAMGSESEFLARLQESGRRFIYVPTARVDHVISAEQLSMRWLLRRVYRYGRGRVRRQHCQQVARGDGADGHGAFMGVPRTLWRQLPKASMRYFLSFVQTGHHRYDSAEPLFLLMGQMYEHRLIWRERKKGTQSSLVSSQPPD